MSDDRWQSVAALYHAAQEQAAEERSSFVKQAAAGDSDLRREVESLLALDDRVVAIDEHIAAAARSLLTDNPCVQPTGVIGPYRIDSLLGVGGMGEVYRATDMNLKRQVAIKVLPASLAGDVERLARFQREAEILAALNHPNIAHIYGLEKRGGTIALVMELVEGPTLADRIAKGAIPIGEALLVARQIAEALEAAHEQGIIHRDLKPANIKVRDDGAVKVLDFGLAKALEPTAVMSTNVSMSPTITSPAMTLAGMILGTAAYMSPEQAVGKPADKRSDLWSFGVVLLEMLTRRQVFNGETVSHVLASVLKDEPDWSALPGDTPTAIRRLLGRCLAKNRKQRLDSAADARLEIEEALTAPAVEAQPPTGRPRRAILPLAAALIGGAVVAVLATWVLVRPAPVQPVAAHFTIDVPEGRTLTTSVRRAIAISPDGNHVAFVAGGDLFLRSMSEFSAHPIPGVEEHGNTLGTALPLFAPDSQSIVYFALSGGPGGTVVLKRIPIGGGTPSELSAADDPSGATWSDDGIVFISHGAIVRVSPSGGTPEQLVAATAGERPSSPQLLPGGKTVIFTLRVADSPEGQVVAQSIKEGSRRVLVDRGSDAHYLPSGHLTYSVGGTVFAVPFDPEALTKAGEAKPVLVGVRRSSNTLGTNFSVSNTGTLIYVPGPGTLSQLRTFDLVLGTTTSEPTHLKVARSHYEQPRVSPDGRMVAIERDDGNGPDIWTYDLSGTTEMRRLTFGGDNRRPVWSADGRRVTFQSKREGAEGIWWQSADGAGAPERLTTAAKGEEHMPEAWSRDGTRLLFSVVKSSKYSLWVFTLLDQKGMRFGDVESSIPLSASFSRDGRWVAYAFAASGMALGSRDAGVFVEPYPPTREKHQVPKTAIDYQPVWSPDGASILYSPSSSRDLVSLPVTAGTSIAFGTPKAIPHAPRSGLLNGSPRGYDVLPDGRILSVSPAESEGGVEMHDEIRVVLNWWDELRRLVPTK